MEKNVVLICDDSTDIQESLGEYLEAEGYVCLHTTNGTGALDMLRSEKIDAIILDIMLPDISGLDVCREIKKFSAVPILMLSARSETADRVAGLELGADDYVGKPFSSREVAVRLKHIIQKSTNAPSDNPHSLSFANLTLNLESNTASIGSVRVELTVKECKALFYLISNKGKTATREQILNSIWGYDYYGDTRVIDSLIKRLRQKIVMDESRFEIKSVYGVGYRLEETAR